jgi:hypothetical protein
MIKYKTICRKTRQSGFIIILCCYVFCFLASNPINPKTTNSIKYVEGSGFVVFVIFYAD